MLLIIRKGNCCHAKITDFYLLCGLFQKIVMELVDPTYCRSGVSNTPAMCFGNFHTINI